MFDKDAGEDLAAALANYDWIYFSGITLSLYGEAALDRFELALRAAKTGGAKVVMDSNYRPRGWAGDKQRARDMFARFWSLADIALPTFDDEQLLWNDATPVGTITRLGKLGVKEVCVKDGANGAAVFADDTFRQVPCPSRIDPLDTTAAGDSFNAAYLCSRIAGGSPETAALAGHQLAAIVIAHRGAIAPAEAMAGLALTLTVRC